MRKAVIPVLLLLGVFLVSWLCQPFTLICQEYEGLFLATPDAWARAFAQPFPLSGILSDFLIQFYRDPVYGALILFAYYMLIGFSLSRFVTASYTNAVFDKFLNPRIEGAKVNQGLRQDSDEDDEEEEDEEV